MRSGLLGFLIGVSMSGIVWGGSSNTFVQPGAPGSRPDQSWELDRGAAVKQYLHERQQQIWHEQDLKTLRRELEERSHQPC